MKRTIIFLLTCSFLTACASLGTSTSLVGQSFDSYIIQKGVPSSQYTLQNGNIAYSYKTVCEYDSSKVGETLVVVGTDNLIQSISTPTRCPYYYETDEYKYQQQMEQRKKSAKKRISDLEKSLDGIATSISVQQSIIRSTQMDLDWARRKNDTAAVAKYEQELKKLQDKLSQDEKYQAEWKREIEQLKRTLRD